MAYLRAPVLEFGPGKNGTINIYERRGDWLYDSSKPINPKRGKRILLKSIEPVKIPGREDSEKPNDLEATLIKAAEEIAKGHSESHQKRWENYMKSSQIVFIVEGNNHLYRSHELATFLANSTTKKRFTPLLFDVESPNKKETGRLGHFYLVRNPKKA